MQSQLPESGCTKRKSVCNIGLRMRDFFGKGLKASVACPSAEGMAHPATNDNPHLVDLRTLTAHAESIPAATTVEAAQTALAEKDIDFVAVLNGSRLIGVCTRRDLAQQLGSRYGFALNARQPVSAFLMRAPLKVSTATPLTSVFKAATARGPLEFYDDVLLVEPDGRYAGMIPMRALVRLQTEFLLRNNAQLEASRDEIAEKNLVMEKDLLMAREVQLAMLPPAHAPFSAGGLTLRLAHRYQPAGSVSGDFYDVLRISDDVAGILVCDVMGHGARSALVTAMVRAMMEELRPFAADPGVLLTRLNRNLRRILHRTGSLIFVTAAYAVIHLGLRRLRYAQAGHPTPLRWDAAARTVRKIDCPSEIAGPALGLIVNFEFATVEEDFGAGDRLVLFTDGVFEAANPAGEEFGAERLVREIERSVALPLDGSVQTLLNAVGKFCAGAPFADDVCIIAAEVTQSERG
jgi:sigma-B regulation protein RsbU (phosphoserine phosphatase)